MGEYIKREDAIHAIKKWEHINAEGYKNYVGKDKNVIEIFNTYMTAHRLDIELIEKLPAADVAEVKHEKWFECKEHIYLENGICKEWTNFYCLECDAPSDNPYNYCPNCGAKMDKEE